MRFVLSSLLIVIGTASLASAATLNVPGDYGSIEAALTAAEAGDTVLVGCGIYNEHDLALKSGVLLLSETGGGYCATIDAGELGRVLLCQDVDDTAAVVGFMLTGGMTSAGNPGGGIYCDNSSPRFENCIIRDNYSQSVPGGGVACVNGSAPTFAWCDFTWNTASSSAGHGGGVYIEGSTPSFADCQTAGNSAGGNGGGLYATAAAFSVTHCNFAENTSVGSGGGVYLSAISDANFILVTFFGNYAVGGGGGLYCNDSSPALTNCTIVENSCSGAGAGIHVGGTSFPCFSQIIVAFNTLAEGVTVTGGNVTFVCSDISGNAGGDWLGPIAPQLGQDGNFSADPQFCGVSSSGNYYLQMDSPCAPGNNDCGILIGSRIVDCGYITTESANWSTIKSMY